MKEIGRNGEVHTYIGNPRESGVVDLRDFLSDEEIMAKLDNFVGETKNFFIIYLNEIKAVMGGVVESDLDRASDALGFFQKISEVRKKSAVVLGGEFSVNDLINNSVFNKDPEINQSIKAKLMSRLMGFTQTEYEILQNLIKFNL